MKEWLEDRASLFGKKHTKELQLCLSIAPQLVQAVRYDIPAIKKTICRLNNQRTETLASVEDAPRAEQQQRSLQRQLLASYGISASDLERGATTLESLLEDRICEVERSVTLFLATEVPSTLPKCIEVYEKQLAQVRFVSTVGSSSLFAQHFPWLSRALEESDVLASSAKQSHAAQASHSNEAAADAPEPTIDIDWGDDDDVVGATTTGTAAADGGPHVEINWGDEDTEEQGELNGGAPTTSAPPEDIGAPPLRTITGAPSVMVARADHRAALVHELSALEMFLDEHVLDTLQRDGIADTAEQRVKHCPSLTTYIQQVSGIVKRLTVGNDANLLRMRNNFRLKEKWMNSVEDTDRVVARIRARAATADQRVAAMSDEIAKLTPQVEELIATSKTQQKACEEALQRVFPDREVLIVGDINAL
ncbi:Hypothetical protein, putative [Bodo saltans]|uniref:Uncharacterized protein n=1 Tax=Bodo saltans TaxID=75058 RepID=A0A0S4JRC2_BODSA|nr:Hypothetical protein, putative [Bodo saltans]|eukprot:CUG91067.1 Hypothetical protein, putative [Bodo saltans]